MRVRVGESSENTARGERVSRLLRIKQAVLTNDSSLLRSEIHKTNGPISDSNYRDIDGWSFAHHALYSLNLVITQLLLSSGLIKESALSLSDPSGLTPLDLISIDDTTGIRSNSSDDSGRGGWAVFSWGSGVNFCLGTPAETHLQPTRVDSILSHSTSKIIDICASKYASAALNEDGEVFTWGWAGGKGPRLGHADVTNLAQILPRQVLTLPAVTSIAAGKHHMVVSTAEGDVYTWGSNSLGQLGLPGMTVTESPTPRLVPSLKGKRVVSVSASNVHSVAITQQGEILTWGSNSHGQLGYQAINKASLSSASPSEAIKQLSSDHNPSFLYGVSPKNIRGAQLSFSHTPRLVDGMKGRRVVAGSCSKRHTVVVTDKGEVFTWGFRNPTPKKVSLAPRASSIRYHKGHSEIFRPVALSVSAGFTHTSVITQGGRVLTWYSADPSFKSIHICLPGERRARFISAGKLSTSIVSSDGALFLLEQDSSAQDPPSSLFLCSSAASASSSFSGLLHAKPPSPQSFIIPTASPPHASSVSSLGGTSSSSSLGGGVKVKALGSSPPPNPFFTTPHHNSVLKRIEGIRRVERVSRGEKHSLAIVSYHVPSILGPSSQRIQTKPEDKCEKQFSRRETLASDEDDEGWHPEEDSEDEAEDGPAGEGVPSALTLGLSQPLSHLGWEDQGSFEALHADIISPLPSLQSICQLSVAKHMVEVRSVCQLLEYADASGALYLRYYCIAYCLSNFDCVLLDNLSAFVHLPLHLVELLESRLKNWMMTEADKKDDEAVKAPSPVSLSSHHTADSSDLKAIVDLYWRPQPFNQGRRPTLFTPHPTPPNLLLGFDSKPLSPATRTASSKDQPSSSSRVQKRDRATVEVVKAALDAVHSLPLSRVSTTQSSAPSNPFCERSETHLAADDPTGSSASIVNRGYHSSSVGKQDQLINLNPISDDAESVKKGASSSGSTSISAAAGGRKGSSKKVALDVFLKGPVASASKTTSPPIIATPAPAPWSKGRQQGESPPDPATSLRAPATSLRAPATSLRALFYGEASQRGPSSSQMAFKPDKVNETSPSFTLGDFMKPQPQPKPSNKTPVPTRAWAAPSPSPSLSSSAPMGTSPPSTSSVSLRSIQEEQEKRKISILPGSSPPAPSSLLLGSNPPANKWYVADENKQQSHAVHLIQEEEAAMKELRRRFPNAEVRVKRT